MTARNIRSIRGAIHDIDHLRALSAGGCNIRILSDRAIYVLTNIAFAEVEYLGRYGRVLPGGLFEPVDDSATADYQLYLDTVYEVQEGVSVSDCVDIAALTAAVQGINVTLQRLATGIATNPASCGCTLGTQPPTPGSYDPGDPPPDGYQPPTVIDGYNYRCDIANLLWQDSWQVMDSLIDVSFESLLSLGLGVSTAVIEAVLAGPLIAAGPVGWGILAIGGAAGLLASFFINSLDLSGLQSSWEASKNAIICWLYNTTSLGQAIEDWPSYVDSLIPSNYAQQAFLKYLINGNALACLFYEPEDISEALSQRRQEITSFMPCSGCSGGGDWFLTLGTAQGGASVDDIANQWVIFDVDAPTKSVQLALKLSGAYEDWRADVGNDCTSYTGVPQPIRWAKPIGSDGFVYAVYCDGSDLVAIGDYPIAGYTKDDILDVRLATNGSHPFALTTNPALFASPPSGYETSGF